MAHHHRTEKSTLSLYLGTVAIRNPERHMRKALHRGSKQQ